MISFAYFYFSHQLKTGLRPVQVNDKETFDVVILRACSKNLMFSKDEIPQFRTQIYLFANAHINLVLIANDLPLFFRKTPEK
ncbi:hypothetical protein SDC9_127197 [bioreactor metagenome]|uniref:Uncharacterized protein n=1 Tax=bioreactor metagenome TaxID=1076179 RepID=A0A645CTA9_9ZZZZ